MAGLNLSDAYSSMQLPALSGIANGFDIGNVASNVQGLGVDTPYSNMYTNLSLPSISGLQGITAPSTGGFMDVLSGLGQNLGSGLDVLGKYKDGIGIAGSLGLGLANYQQQKKQSDMMEQYYNSLISEQQRQASEEEKAKANMEAGLKASNYYNV